MKHVGGLIGNDPRIEDHEANAYRDDEEEHDYGSH